MPESAENSILRGLVLKFEGRNSADQKVRSAKCGCGWVHMTAYRRFHRTEADEYLIRQFNAHPCLKVMDRV